MTLLEKAKLDGRHTFVNLDGSEFPYGCPWEHGYETKKESKSFCIKKHSCKECYAREYREPDQRATPLTISEKLSLIDAYLTELTDPKWRDMILEYREYLTRKQEPEKAVTRESILRDAITATCTDRNHQYGEPERSFPAIAELWTAYLHANGFEVQIEAEDAALMLALLKIARTASAPDKADNYIDLAGYAACAGEIACRGGA